MNNIIKIALFGLITCFSACISNPCSDVACSNNGTCREGACACPSGFEGNFCQNKSADKFLGYWEGYKKINGGIAVNTTLVVTPGSGPNEIILTALSFSGLNIPIKATCKLTDLNIPEQTADGSSGFQYSGTGFIEDGKNIRIIYHEKNNQGITNTCLYEGTKKIIP